MDTNEHVEPLADQLEHPPIATPAPSAWLRSAMKYAVRLGVVGAAGLLFYVLLQQLAFWFTANYVADHLDSVQGIPKPVMWIVAFILASGLMWAIAQAMPAFLFGFRRKQALIAVGALVPLFFFLDYVGGPRFFTRDGKPIVHAVDTVYGPKFSEHGGVDRETGRPYELVSDAEMAYEKARLSKYPTLDKAPPIEPGVYFSSAGDPLVWYVERGQDTYDLFPIPIADPLTGKRLRPVNAEIVGKILRKVSTARPYDPKLYSWQKSGSVSGASVEMGSYFDEFGKPRVWVVERDGKIFDMFPTEGSDPLTGKPLAPITEEIVTAALASKFTLRPYDPRLYDMQLQSRTPALPAAPPALAAAKPNPQVSAPAMEAPKGPELAPTDMAEPTPTPGRPATVVASNPPPPRARKALDAVPDREQPRRPLPPAKPIREPRRTERVRADAAPGHYELRPQVAPTGEHYDERVWVPGR